MIPPIIIQFLSAAPTDENAGGEDFIEADSDRR